MRGSRAGSPGLSLGRGRICAGWSRGWSGRTAGRWPSRPAGWVRTGCSGCCVARTGTSTVSATICGTTSLNTWASRMACWSWTRPGFLTKGIRSAGVQRQYSGTAGRVAGFGPQSLEQLVGRAGLVGQPAHVHDQPPYGGSLAGAHPPRVAPVPPVVIRASPDVGRTGVVRRTALAHFRWWHGGSPAASGLRLS